MDCSLLIFSIYESHKVLFYSTHNKSILPDWILTVSLQPAVASTVQSAAVSEWKRNSQLGLCTKIRLIRESSKNIKSIRLPN